MEFGAAYNECGAEFLRTKQCDEQREWSVIEVAQNVGDYLIQRLRQWDVEKVFGYAGDGINSLLASWVAADDPPEFVEARHEEMAAFEATGYAKFSGKVGVCAATSGPGAIHLLNGLYDAKLDHVPVVAIVGQTNRTAMGGSYQQEVDLLSLYKDVASEYVQMVTTPQQLPNVLDRAMRISLSRRTVTAIILPADVQELEYSPPEHAFKMVPSSLGITTPVTVAGQEGIRDAAEVLNSGKKVAMLVGQGARGAREEVVEIADRLGAGVAKALLGKDALPDDLPFVTGAIGLLGTRPSYEMMMECDTLLIIGSSFPYSQFLPEFDQARGVEIDINPSFVGLRYPTEVNLVGDAQATLLALLEHVEHKEDRSWREDIEKKVESWWKTMEAQAMLDADPINPMRIFWELSGQLPSDAVVTADSGSAANWYARHVQFSENVRGSLSGTLATMGPGVPYAIGAKFASPQRPAIALVGDGAMQMNGLAELITIKRYYEHWEDPRLVVCVLHNNDLNQVTWEMRAMSGSPKFIESQKLPDIDYAQWAESLGLGARIVTDPEQLNDAWQFALNADRPVVLDVHCDPSVPPIPPHATFEQAKELAASLIKGDPDRWDAIKQGVKTKVQEFLPHGDKTGEA